MSVYTVTYPDYDGQMFVAVNESTSETLHVTITADESSKYLSTRNEKFTMVNFSFIVLVPPRHA